MRGGGDGDACPEGIGGRSRGGGPVHRVDQEDALGCCSRGGGWVSQERSGRGRDGAAEGGRGEGKEGVGVIQVGNGTSRAWSYVVVRVV